MLCKVLFWETEEFMLSLVKDSLEHTVVVLCISLGHPILTIYYTSSNPTLQGKSTEGVQCLIYHSPFHIPLTSISRIGLVTVLLSPT